MGLYLLGYKRDGIAVGKMDSRIIKWYVYTAGLIFFAAAVLRFAVLAQNTHLSRLLLKSQDPLLGFTVRREVWGVAFAELALAVACFWNIKFQFRILIIGWAVTSYFMFRAGLFFLNLQLQNSCIGSLSDPWHLAQGVPHFFVKILSYYLLVGSYGALLWPWFQGAWQNRRDCAARKEIQAGIVKMVCHSCGGHIKFAGQNIGQKIACPHCQKAITLRRLDERLKMMCFFCGGHIEFPAHAIGGKIPCPHCKMDITLKELSTA